MSKKSLMLHIAVRLAAAILILLPGLALHAQAYTTIVVIGDSLSDTGNDTTVSKGIYGASAAIPSPATGYTNGSFTDGTDTSPAAVNYNGVWIKQLAALFPAKPAVVNSLAGGTNYAYGFATTNTGTNNFTYGPGNALSFPVNNMGLQVTTYLATKPTITNKTLFVVWGGANDLIAATSSSDITAAAQRDAALVQQLINAGATDFLIPNLPPLGLVPLNNGSTTTSIPATGASQLYDGTLAQLLAALPGANPGKTLHIYQLDTYTLFNTIVGPPIYKGFVNVTTPSQATSVNPDTYLFWDDLHPTTYGHSILAATAETLLSGPVTTSTVLTASNYNPNPGASVTLTATVSTTSSTPMGTVTFMAGQTVLGTALVFGSGATATATLTTATLPAGSSTLQATFAGTNGYSNSASAFVGVDVSVPAIQVSTTTPAFSIPYGSQATAFFQMQGLGGFAGTISYSCTLPADFTCSFTPASGATPGAGGYPVVNVSISDFQTSSLATPMRPGQRSREMYSALAFLPILLGGAMFGRRRLRSLSLVLLLGVVAAAGLGGCSSATHMTDAAAGAYTIPVLFTSSVGSTTVNLSVTVQ